MVENHFFSKDMIINLNKIVLHNIPNKNLSHDHKQQILNLVIKNMKQVYKSMDVSKINNNNFNSILDQFKQFSIKETLNEIKNLYNNPQAKFSEDKTTTASELKFNRDFKTTIPNNNTRIMERPIATIKNSLSSSNPTLDKINFNGNNNYGDINKFQMVRNTEINMRNRPKTPDFLKSTKTSDKPDTLNEDHGFKENSFTEGFENLANDMGDNLFSIDNIDKPLISGEQIVEDTSKFEDRLKRLQQERNNLQPILQELSKADNKIDFTNDELFSQNSFNFNDDEKKKR